MKFIYKILFFSVLITACQTTVEQKDKTMEKPKPSISFTFDDPHHRYMPLMDWKERDSGMLAALQKHNIEATLFVCAKRVDDNIGRQILENWQKAGHRFGNHSYSHYYYHSPKMTVEDYKNDFIKGDSFVNQYENFNHLYRFPFLKQGETKAKRDSFRNTLKEYKYKIGYVTIDASDWYIDNRIKTRLEENINADLTPFRDFYLAHIWERAQYYDSLATQLKGRKIKHTLLLHHNLVSALFLDDLIQMFKDKGWNIIDATAAFEDPIFDEYPEVLPAGESIVWSLAKQSGQYENQLRYPAEDSQYEMAKMDSLGL